MWHLSKSKRYRKDEKACELPQAKLQKMETALQNDPIKGTHIGKIVGYETSYRYRIGDKRIMYTVEEEVKNVNLNSIENRGEAYKNRKYSLSYAS